jgi:hypothetical protein
MGPALLGGYAASAGLAASGLAGVIVPQRVGRMVHTDLAPPRARAEWRSAYACFAGLGAYALIVGSPAVFLAVGTLWLAAGAIRVLAVVLDRPQLDWTYWSFLTIELVLGTAGVLAGP